MTNKGLAFKIYKQFMKYNITKIIQSKNEQN